MLQFNYMQLGYIGLGKMGSNMVTRLLKKRHKITVYDVDRSAAQKLQRKGAISAESIKAMIELLEPPRLVWIMVPHKHVVEVIKELVKHLGRGDTIVDGGNSFYKDSMVRSKRLKRYGVNYLDVGVSGGPNGALEGASMMIGGSRGSFQKYEQIFKDLTVANGYGYMGSSGAGHFVKMVHNGIEYGMMQAYAEGFDVLRKSPFKLNLREVARVYNHGTVIESRLGNWLESGMKEYGNELTKVSGKAIGTGEGAWTVDEAKRMNIDVPVIKAALQARKRAHKKPSFQGKIIMALRNQFGGHSIKEE